MVDFKNYRLDCTFRFCVDSIHLCLTPSVNNLPLLYYFKTFIIIEAFLRFHSRLNAPFSHHENITSLLLATIFTKLYSFLLTFDIIVSPLIFDCCSESRDFIFGFRVIIKDKRVTCVIIEMSICCICFVDALCVA